DREIPLTDYHTAFHIHDTTEATEPAGGGTAGVTSAVEDTIALFTLLGWSATVARAGVEYVCARLAEASSRTSAFEALRRDYHARALLDLPGSSWLAMLRVVLGNPDPDLTNTAAG